MNDLNIPDDLLDQIAEKLINLSEEGAITWSPFTWYGNWGYITEYTNYYFYISARCDYSHDLYIMQGHLPHLTSCTRIYTNLEKRLYTTATKHSCGDVDGNELVEILGLVDTQAHIFLSSNEKAFLARSHRTGNAHHCGYYDYKNPLHDVLIKKGYLRRKSGRDNPITLTTLGATVARKCYEELDGEDNEQ
jgi:hypothetical protein